VCGQVSVKMSLSVLPKEKGSNSKATKNEMLRNKRLIVGRRKLFQHRGLRFVEQIPGSTTPG
jgi:hypothetical protein